MFRRQIVNSPKQKTLVKIYLTEFTTVNVANALRSFFADDQVIVSTAKFNKDLEGKLNITIEAMSRQSLNSSVHS